MIGRAALLVGTVLAFSGCGQSDAKPGVSIRLARPQIQPASNAEVRFRLVDQDSRVVRDFDISHTKRLHVVLAKRDLSVFRHLHPTQREDGSWITRTRITRPGNYRLFADFVRNRRRQTVEHELRVAGVDSPIPLPVSARAAEIPGGYAVTRTSPDAVVGEPSKLEFDITRNGRSIRPEPYLGARGHLVTLREGDLEFLHVHPVADFRRHGRIAFSTVFPTSARYRLFLQFKGGGKVRTVAFTEVVRGTAEAPRRNQPRPTHSH